MSRHDRYLFGLFVARWGFAAMVAAAILVGLAAAMTVAPPEQLPSIASRAPVAFRVEVGAIVFLGLYLATMAFVLALHMVAESESRELLADLIDEVDEVKGRLRGDQIVN